jgi:hypothetical protein
VAVNAKYFQPPWSVASNPRTDVSLFVDASFSDNDCSRSPLKDPDPNNRRKEEVGWAWGKALEEETGTNPQRKEVKLILMFGCSFLSAIWHIFLKESLKAPGALGRGLWAKRGQVGRIVVG